MNICVETKMLLSTPLHISMSRLKFQLCCEFCPSSNADFDSKDWGPVTLWEALLALEGPASATARSSHGRHLNSEPAGVNMLSLSLVVSNELIQYF